MNIVTTPREDHQTEMLVEVEAERMESAKRRAARKIAEKAKIPGFRPGKAPYEVVARYFGESAIVEKAIEDLAEEVYPEALKDASIEPGGMGHLESIEEVNPPRLKFVVPLSPVVELGEYLQVRYPYEWQSPPESEVEEETKNLLRVYATTENVERGIQEEDYVAVDVIGRKVDAAEDEEPVVEHKGFALVIRDKQNEDEFPFAGFSQQLLGLKPGESKNILHTYPDNSGDEKLNGQSVSFEVKIRVVRAVSLPTLNDEFAQEIGMGNTAEELRKKLYENLQRRSQEKYEDEYYTAVIDKIMEGAVIKYPPQALEHEIEHVMENIKERLKNQGMDFETYLKVRETNLETFIEEQARPAAVKRLKHTLVMDKLASAEKIEISAEEVNAETQNLVKNLMREEEFRKRTNNGKKLPENLMRNILFHASQNLISRKVLERVRLIATGQAEQRQAEEQSEEKSPQKDEEQPALQAEGQAAAPAEEKAARKKSARKSKE